MLCMMCQPFGFVHTSVCSQATQSFASLQHSQFPHWSKYHKVCCIQQFVPTHSRYVKLQIRLIHISLWCLLPHKNVALSVTNNQVRSNVGLCLAGSNTIMKKGPNPQRQIRRTLTKSSKPKRAQNNDQTVFTLTFFFVHNIVSFVAFLLGQIKKKKL